MSVPPAAPFPKALTARPQPLQAGGAWYISPLRRELPGPLAIQSILQLPSSDYLCGTSVSGSAVRCVFVCFRCEQRKHREGCATRPAREVASCPARRRRMAWLALLGVVPKAAVSCQWELGRRRVCTNVKTHRSIRGLAYSVLNLSMSHNGSLGHTLILEPF